MTLDLATQQVHAKTTHRLGLLLCQLYLAKSGILRSLAMEGTTVTAGQEIKFGNSTAVIMDPTASK